VTQLLRAWSGGDERALEQLLPLVETELRRLARAYMAPERGGAGAARVTFTESLPLARDPMLDLDPVALNRRPAKLWLLRALEGESVGRR
jgi:hypothetical protein